MTTAAARSQTGLADTSTEQGREEIRRASEAGRLINVTGDNIEEVRRQLHGPLISGLPYQELIAPIKTKLIERTAIGFAGDLIARMKPRDDVERMLIEHSVWTHGRLFKLNMLLAKTERVADLRILSELVDRASNDFRKCMLALAEYRRPRRAPKFIGQLNSASQQIVQNNGGRNAKTITAPKRKALPPAPNQSRRSRCAGASNSRSKAVAPVNRTTKRRG